MSVQILGTRYLDHIQCPICLELFDDPIITKCSHTFCNKCVKLLQVCPFDQTSLVHSQHTKNRSLRDLIEFLEENITVDEANNIIKRGTYIDSFKVMGYTITLNWKLFFLVGALIEIIVRVPLIVCLKALALVLTFSLSLKMSKLLFKGVIRAVLTLATVLNRISSPLEKSMSLGGYVFGFFSLPFALSYPRFERFFFESWQTMALCFFVFLVLTAMVHVLCLHLGRLAKLFIDNLLETGTSIGLRIKRKGEQMFRFIVVSTVIMKLFHLLFLDPEISQRFRASM